MKRFPEELKVQGLLDEVSILLGPGIDGRKGMTATFDGLPAVREPVNLKLKDVKVYEDGAVWLSYSFGEECDEEFLENGRYFVVYNYICLRGSSYLSR